MFMIGSFAGGLGEGIESGFKFGEALQKRADFNKLTRDADKAAAGGAPAAEPEPRVIDTGAKPPSATSGSSTPEYNPNDPANDKLPAAPPPGQPVNVQKLRTGLTPKSPIKMTPQAIGTEYEGPPEPQRPPDRPEYSGPPEPARPGDTYAGPPQPQRPLSTEVYRGPPEPQRPFSTENYLGPPDATGAGLRPPSASLGYQTAPEGHYQALDLGYSPAPESAIGQNLVGGQPRPRVQWRGQGARANPYGGAPGGPPSSQFAQPGPYGPQYAAPGTAFRGGGMQTMIPQATLRPPRRHFVDALGNPIQYDTDGNPVSYY